MTGHSTYDTFFTMFDYSSAKNLSTIYQGWNEKSMIVATL